MRGEKEIKEELKFAEKNFKSDLKNELYMNAAYWQIVSAVLKWVIRK